MPIYADGHIVTAAEFNAMMPVGVCLPFGAATAPSGWLLCDGSAVSRTTYADLFSVIGTVHGAGDGSTTFNVPDLRGRIAVGKNSGTFATLGGSGGEETHTLSTAELASHNHGGGGGTSGQSVSHTHSGTTDSAGVGDTINSPQIGTGSGSSNFTFLSDQSATHTHTFTTGSASTDHAHNYSIPSAGSDTAHNNLQPYLTLLYIIRY